MKIKFEDNSFVEVKLSNNPGKIDIVLGSKDADNPLNFVVNSAEITIKQFSELVNDLEIPLPKIVKK